LHSLTLGPDQVSFQTGLEVDPVRSIPTIFFKNNVVWVFKKNFALNDFLSFEKKNKTTSF
jgi:hypothetical protein